MNSAKIQQTRWFTLVYVAAASAFPVLVAMGMAGMRKALMDSVE